MGIGIFFIHRGLNKWTGSNALSTIISLVLAIIIYFALLILMKGVSEEELENIPKGDAIIRFLYWCRILKR
jgi:stage V sporulation protein B